jgi:hypothetical protein
MISDSERPQDRSMTSENAHACSICGGLLSGDGNDAEPVSDGSCCDDCNERYVIPVRLEEELRAAEREAGRRQRWQLH